jgi:hypothetical protein
MAVRIFGFRPDGRIPLAFEAASVNSNTSSTAFQPRSWRDRDAECPRQVLILGAYPVHCFLSAPVMLRSASNRLPRRLVGLRRTSVA